MTPNLFLATQTLFSPHKWFRHQAKTEKAVRKIEHWDVPVPGLYEYIPGRGWYQIAKDEPSKNAENGEVPTIKLPQPVQVKYSRVLRRSLLAPDYEKRKRQSFVEDKNGKRTSAGFFKLDEGKGWVMAWDDHGEFIPGPYKLWIPDTRTDTFRHMLKSDDPEYASSRRNSVEPQRNHRGSQDSRSTQYRPGPRSSTEFRSQPSTRANSYCGGSRSQPVSRANSRPNTRPSSPTSSRNIPLSEATTLQNSESVNVGRISGGSLEKDSGSAKRQSLRAPPVDRV
ncbi:hypothetical protein GQ43DRAFT_138066 [Delitschia confertaspora ATCC 74209]|uniref:Uncharacterized protein n=1 Tax=Delitschia confertaspora ATCC 74209 TaxID=1513339 RepID=A0A9P4JKP9_9PLEO|nr:hypothetical protein GQ43DRAFT_138066 [Delitschia confertaspora ATCC 74209]